MKVLISDNLSPSGVEILKKAGLEVDARSKTSVEEIEKIIGDYDALIIRSATKVTAALLEKATKLKVVGRAGSGLDNVDIPAATKKGVAVMNTPGGNTVTTAEHTIGMLFACARMIPQAYASLREGKWEKKKYEGVELFDKTMGIIGLGAIGGVVAVRCVAMGMKVLAYDPFISPEKAKSMNIELADLPTIYRNADFITLHTPKTKETANLINKDTIGQMKDGVRIINCARGGIVNEQDLYEALKSGKVGGAAFDVFDKEPPENHPLLTLENFIATPHLGASTREAQENVAVAVAEQVVDYLVAGTVRNAVNVPSVPADQLPALSPYINLAERMGLFEAQLYEGGLTEVSLEYSGDVAELKLEPITLAALKGLLTPILKENVNYVNAPLIAKDRGIEVKVGTTSGSSEYTSLITLKVKANGKQALVAGTLNSKKEPRIVQVDNFPMETVPDGYMLVLMNNDKPGVIGGIGTILGQNGINIARMQFGREKQGGLAVSVVSIDSPVSDDLMEKIKKLPNVLSVKLIKI
ncbi:MAG: phosphoglycerate dehydrogenase [Nitrospirae bacterium GWC2_57_13]|jgi:D-3-phosphoglycerate dehydrogenase / 2-oxoglutarate reductase|nr:MAG: phosphoglycerate dehydrogenase [Nitrospirae bacterium GWC1_57_7]OGW29198.1 MAG: phosphoglycerate dehydrogenase [Nitrospirae bacterium GWC2_57_13]HAR45490.1 phosphoglycerate dehydrogenase [Nitrospiraceae bacterium]